ncbi:MAG: hypothetical protein A2Z98_09130 [Spirochaetes bacterium GWB1_27_13]|nr:MAG: hypothetical protein A2Z98_09130 [Spirochaetes bacterium GWB1_27_13]
MRLGFDFGSKNIGAVVIDGNKIVKTYYISHNGDIAKNFRQISQEIYSNYPIETFGITGSIDFANLKTIDSILANVEANKFLNTNCRNIFYVGCETFSLIILDESYNYIEHAINPLCASGTGSFLDQQAERIGLTTEKLAEIAYNFNGKTPSIATRCAVFAKSDIIHSQADGYSKEAIATGLCEGMALSIVSNLVKGRELIGDASFIGGVSKNKKIVKEVSKILDKDIKIIENGEIFSAIGACVLGKETNFDIENILSNMQKNRERRDKLEIKLTNYPDFTNDKFYIEDGVEITEYKIFDKKEYSIYIGVDVGSTSTKAIVTDGNTDILLGLYTKTAGEPVIATQKLFAKIKKIFDGKDLTIKGVGTTGSGRKLVKEIINADLEINEITAHAKAAIFIDPEVDTIIEIGGQDSKFTLLKDGNVIQSTMNYVCAAGTGSFIEEQAKRLGVTLDEISELAIGQKAPYTSDRCTVYMERDLNIFLSEGWTKQEILSSVLYSVRDNYLSKVVGKTPLGEKIFFQGATARNKALVAVFENEVERPISVSKYCHLTGALGICIILKEKGINLTKFSGMDFKFNQSTEICNLCINNCNLTIYEVNGKKTAWGLKCGRDYDDKKFKIKPKNATIESKFNEIFQSNNNFGKNRLKVGIPVTLYLSDLYPLFKDFFEKLGFEVILEKGNSKKMKEGAKLINSDFCAPMTLMAGLVHSLKDRVDYIFLPAMINGELVREDFTDDPKFYDKIRDSYYCYYSEYAATIVNNFHSLDIKQKLISPMLKFNINDKSLIAEEIANSTQKITNFDKEDIKRIFLECFDVFRSKKQLWQDEGKKIIEQNPDKIKIMFIGRPYSIFDNNINLGIPAKIEEMGFDVVYQSMFSYKNEELPVSKRFLHKMHWYFGQEILLAGEYAAKSKNIYPVFLTCFRCSPDSYLITYFKEIMKEYQKPYLVIQLDEHASDVGYQTRIEAAIETFLTDAQKTKKIDKIEEKLPKNDKITKETTVLIPYLSPIISQLQEYAFKAYNYNALVLPIEQKMINSGYKYASGGECMPNIAIIGSLIETIKQNSINPEKAILYMPTVCMGCNFNQYAVLIDLALEKAGFGKIKIANPNTLKQMDELPKELNVNLFEINVLGSILYKLLFRYKPYEKNVGETKDVFEKSINLIKDYLFTKKSLMEAARTIKSYFENIQIDKTKRKPRIGILGDLYAKYNYILNQDIYSLIEELDGEILIPSFTETVLHFLDADIRENGLDVKYKKGAILFERRYERIFEDLIGDSIEPNIDECNDLMKEYGINHLIAGESSMNVGRMLYYAKHKTVDAVVHLNPVFCCPGVVSSSLFRKMQKDFDIPIIDLFYDGTNKPNKVIIPQLYYLNKK